jgi:Elongation factor Tu domain 2
VDAERTFSACCGDHRSLAAICRRQYVTRPVLSTDGFEGFCPMAKHGQRRAGANPKRRWSRNPGAPAVSADKSLYTLIRRIHTLRGEIMMPTGKKAKAKAKRKKTRVTKAAPRRKSTVVRKSKAIRKKAAKKPPRRVSLKKTRSTAKAGVKPRPATEPTQLEAARTTPSPPAQPASAEERIGVVTHYYGHPSVATLRLESGTLRVGDVIHIRRHTTDFSQKVESLEVNHAPVTEVRPSDDFGLKVVKHVRAHDLVFKVRP